MKLALYIQEDGGPAELLATIEGKDISAPDGYPYAYMNALRGLAGSWMLWTYGTHSTMNNWVDGDTFDDPCPIDEDTGLPYKNCPAARPSVHYSIENLG